MLVMAHSHMHVFLSQVLELTKEWTNKWNETQNILKVCHHLSDQRLIFITSFTEPGFECVFWRVCWTGGNSGSEEGGNRSDPGLRAASSHRDWWWSAQHRHHSLSFKGNAHPPEFITVWVVKREMPLQLNEFISLLLCCLFHVIVLY